MSTAPDADDLQRCIDLRNEEWEVIQSIYPDYISSDDAEGVVKLEIPVEFLDATQILVALEDDQGDVPHVPNGVKRQSELVSLVSLPPLLLEVLLPPLYPLRLPPTILSIHATHSWLNPATVRLQHRLVNLWQPGEGALYTWMEWIRGGDFLDALGLTNQTDGKIGIRIPHPAPRLLSALLVSSDTNIQQSRFSETSYSCEICLTSIKGARCLRLACSHVFCRSCLEDFWKLCIKEGDVTRVGCPDPTCVKEAREASEEEVRRVVTEEEVQRWKWLRQKRLFEIDPTMVHCPVQFCQNPVPRPANVDEDSPWERLRTCGECGYSFCAYCRRTWHGTINECAMSSTESFVLEYMAHPEGSPARESLEHRYGRANLRRLVAKYEEDQANKKWLDESTMACPSCRINVEKSHGCNHMTCAKCGQHFCYRCGGKLQASNPYQHFSTPGLACFSKLFDHQSADLEWQPVAGFDML